MSRVKSKGERGPINHYIYEINLLCGDWAGKYYIGKRTTKSDPYKDGYAGSGKILSAYYKKYGKIAGKTFEKVILEFNGSSDQNALREKEIIGDAWKTDNRCINLQAGGCGVPFHNPYNTGREKKVVQLTLDDKVVKIWDSGRSAARALSLDSSRISKCCLNRNGCRSTGGYKWRLL